MRQRGWLSHLSVMLLAGSVAGTALAQKAPDEAEHSRLRSGQIIYDFYQDDALTTLTRIALSEQQGMTPADAQQAELLAGGVSIAYGMPEQARQKLQALLNDPDSAPRTRILSWYWLSRLYFSQQRFAQASESYDRLLAVASQSDTALESVLTPQQWTTLNYQAAHLSLLLDKDTAYASKLDATNIETYYLLYNQGVKAFQKQRFDDAARLFEQAQTGLQQFIARPETPESDGLLSWLGWHTQSALPQTNQNEYHALLNRVLLARGQALLAKGKLALATDVFGQISGQTAARDEALLGYGWALAQGDDWPMAMGIWQFLTTQPENLFTLQARHALAVGYARNQGYQQAFNQLKALDARLDLAMQSLASLNAQTTTTAYWLTVGKKLGQQEEADTGTPVQPWPSVHKDILNQLLTKEGPQSTFTLLQQLVSLNTIAETLQHQLSQTRTFSFLLDERKAEHHTRSQKMETQDFTTRITLLDNQLNLLQSRYDLAVASQQSGADDEAYLSGLTVLANEAQFNALERLGGAQARFARLAAERAMKPDYAQRLKRIKGLLLWQMSEQYPAQIWAFKKQLKALNSELANAQSAASDLKQSMTSTAPIDADQSRVDELAAQIQSRLTTTQTLIEQITQALSSRTAARLSERHDYLQQQKYASELALLQLQDKWQPEQTYLKDGGVDE